MRRLSVRERKQRNEERDEMEGSNVVSSSRSALTPQFFPSFVRGLAIDSLRETEARDALTRHKVSGARNGSSRMHRRGATGRRKVK